MPQFDTGTFQSQIFWLIVSFVIVLAATSKFIMPLYKKMIQKRVENLEKNIQSTMYLQKEIVKLRLNRIKRIDEAEKESEQKIKALSSRIHEDQKRAAIQFQNVHNEKMKKLEDSIESQKKFIMENIQPFIEDSCEDLIEKFFRKKQS